MRICYGRGTSSIEVDASEMPWAGKPFIEYQEKKMVLLPKEKILAVAKGTQKISAEKYPKSRRKISERYSLVSARGTKILRP